MSERWQRLPRDARDTLFLLAVIGWTVLPHADTVPLWCNAMTAAVLLGRGWLAATSRPLPPRWVTVAMLALALGLTFWSFRTLLGKEPGVTLAVVLMALKTLELRARRDAFVVFFLGFFLVLTHFLFSQSIAVAAAMLVSVWGLLTALVLAHMPVGQPSLARAASLAGRTALMGAPVMVLLFVLFPRIGPLWGVPQDGLGRTGLSNTLSLGSVAEVANDDSIALRLRFPDGNPPAPRSLYFRGPVLAEFDGREWRRLRPTFPAAAMPPAALVVSGPVLRYEVTVEPGRLATVPLLEATTAVRSEQDIALRQNAELEWRSAAPVAQRVRLQGEAHLDFRHGPVEPVLGLQDYLSLPPGFNPRTLQWAAALRREPGLETADGRRLAARVLSHLATGGYTYTLGPGLYGDEQGRHAIDEFWLDRRRGFCEHFAAGFVVVMRALDVPARLVTGYQGADPVPVDGYMVVRQSAAHAWAEFWQPGEGWVRADPTAVVSPDRIQASRNLVPAPGLVAGALAAIDPTLLQRLRSVWEGVDNRWNQWVLSYSRGRQLDLLRHLGFSTPDWQDLALLLALAMVAVTGLGALWAGWQQARRDPWERLQDRILASLRSLGVDATRSDPPRELMRRLLARHPQAAQPLVSLLQELEHWRYAVPAVGAGSPAGPGAGPPTGRQPRPPAPSGWPARWRRAVRALRSGPEPRPGPGLTGVGRSSWLRARSRPRADEPGPSGTGQSGP